MYSVYFSQKSALKCRIRIILNSFWNEAKVKTVTIKRHKILFDLMNHPISMKHLISNGKKTQGGILLQHASSVLDKIEYNLIAT